MDNTTNAKPQAGVAQMREVSGGTGIVGGTPGVLPGGLYRHPVTGIELITQTDPLFGDPQSRAAERVGFEYVGPAPEGSIKTIVTASESHEEQPARAVEAQTAYNKGVEARLNALEAENSRLKAEAASGSAVPGTEPVKGAEAAKQAAADRTELQTGVEVDPATGDEVADSNEDTSEPTYKELQAEAKELGLSSKGTAEELTQRIADAKADKENK
jgi:hypothetical protein